MAHQELGMELLKRVSGALGDIALVEVPPKMEGRQLFVLFAPDPVKIKDLEKANPQMIAAALREKLPEIKNPKTKSQKPKLKFYLINRARAIARA